MSNKTSDASEDKKHKLVLLINAAKNEKSAEKLKKQYIKLLNDNGELPDALYALLESYTNTWDVDGINETVEILNFLRDVVYRSSIFLIDLNEFVDYKYMKRKKNLLIKSSSLSNHYLGSIYDLLAGHNTIAAKVILRAILELEINAKYIFLTSTNENVNRLIVREIEHTLTDLHIVQNGRTRLKDIGGPNQPGQAIALLNRRKQRLGNNPAPSLANRAQAVDDVEEDTYTIDGYLLWYSRYSDSVHGSTLTLDSTTEGLGIAFNGSLDDYREVVEIAILHHLSLLELLEKKVYGNTAKISKMFEELNNFMDGEEKYSSITE